MKIRNEFLQYVIPSMLAFALSGVYAVADGFFVGNAMGDNALAAVNMAFPLTAFLQAAGTGIGMGGAIRYTISAGENKKVLGSQYFGTAVLLLVSAGIILTILFTAGAGRVLHLFGATGSIQSLGEEYLRYISYGALFQVLATGLVPFLRNMGGTVTAMVAMVVGFVTNILLDYVFVWILPWGMMGAAVATALGQLITFLICLFFLILKKTVPIFLFGRDGFQLAKHILGVAVSPFGLSFSPNITLILVNKSAAIFGGSLAVMYYAPVSYISSVVMLLLQGVSDGSQPLISLAYGKGKIDRTRKIRNMAFQFAIAAAAVCMFAMIMVRHRAAWLFGASGQVAEKVAQILPIFICGYIFISISRVTTAFYYAVGRNRKAYILIYAEPLLLLLFLFILPEAAGINGTWFSVLFSQIGTAFISLLIIWKDSLFSEQKPLQIAS